ncbi:ribose 5-phosphate isomerase B [Longirhabdus pacifica]|uniref:ribose 5-phosphate isomerase B n=1 Tax=Longirhabdus pacifica TaxID=2305227 RepID=UPI0010091E8E|nr:ribose 5-phosphate isomerase B [Longirhabdus pacifica]
MKIAIGSDHGGYKLKEVIKQCIQTELGYDVMDVGCHCPDSVDYPDYANEVCEKVVAKEADQGILICGTGIGMSIAANKMKGIRCALVHDMFSAKATREHNNTNVLALGERVIGTGLAQEIVKIWLTTPFSEQERHQKRIDKVTSIEEQHSLQR